MKKTKIASVIVTLFFVFSLLVPATTLVTREIARAHQVILQTAAEQPEKLIRVIVQKIPGAAGVEDQVAQLGGLVTKDLSIINAFAAEMTAGMAEELARNSSVRWISLDASMLEAGAPNKFTTWSTAAGKVVPMGFSNSDYILSFAGPNGTYGSAGQKKASFAGFQPEYPPGQVITKVEVVMKVYLSTTLTTSEAPKITAYADGRQSAIVTVSPTGLNGCVGVSKACFSYVDITTSRTWTWADFNTLEIVIDQTSVGRGKTVYYDAVGLRFTTADGSDGTTPLSYSMSADETAFSSSTTSNVFNQVVRATDVWNTAPYYQGSGITIAVIDSGNFKTNGLGTRLLGVLNFNNSEHTASDRYGHGTHVTGILADGSTNYPGVAPKVNILGLRIADDMGMAYESDIVAAMQWVYTNKAAYNIQVLNLSLNSSVYQSYDTSPLDAACEILWFNGIVVVVSAGNNGSATLYPPANDPFVITVGAIDDRTTVSLADDVITTFSAYGYDDLGRPKPDLVAPGRNIIAYLPDTSLLTISTMYPQNQVTSQYFRMSGTSMAAPVVSGAVALMLQKAQETGQYLNPDQVKYLLTATANKSWAGYDALKAGAGTLDIFAAMNTTLTGASNQGLRASTLLSTGTEPITWNSVGWNSVGWNSVGWNSVGWNSVGWNSVGWNSVGWNSDYFDPITTSPTPTPAPGKNK